MVDHYGTQGRARPEHEARVPAQPRALRVHEVGHAGVRAPSASCRRASASCTRSTSNTSRAACTGRSDGVYYPDSLVGTDSHTTMINGIGVVGWGVGGIEAEAGMLGQPVYFLTPDVVGFELTGAPARRRDRHRPGAHRDRAAAQAQGGGQVRRVLRRRHAQPRGAGPRNHRQHGARVRRDDGLLPGRRSARSSTSRAPAAARTEIEAFEAYFKAQGLFGVPRAGDIDYSQVVRLDLASVTPSLAGPKRPQDRIEIGKVAKQFTSLFSKPPAENGFNQPIDMLLTRHLVRRFETVTARHPRRRRRPARRARWWRWRPTADAGVGARQRRNDAGACDHRQRRRADRRHHQLHQHLQSGRAAGGRSARQEGGGRPACRCSRTSRPRWHRARASSPST